MSVLVVVPVLGRPDRVNPLADSLLESQGDVHLRLLFVVSPNDHREWVAICGRRQQKGDIDALMVDWDPGPADWARKINAAYRDSSESWIFTGADDLCFCPGWADRALECAEETGAQVIGTNDLGNPRVTNGSTATHNLVAREYADFRGTIDGPGAVVAEAYDHNFVDDELVHTAKQRQTWTFCEAAEVPHLHPNWGGADWDETYEKGLKGFSADRRIFHQRRRRMIRAR